MILWMISTLAGLWWSRHTCGLQPGLLHSLECPSCFSTFFIQPLSVDQDRRVNVRRVSENLGIIKIMGELRLTVRGESHRR